VSRAIGIGAAIAASISVGLVLGLVIPVAGAQTPPAPPPGGGQLDASQLSEVPKQTKFVQAEYPPEAQAKGIEADVVLLLDINTAGKVDSVGIAEPADPPGMGFDEAAMAAALQFEFTPARQAGIAIAVQITYRYRFTLTPATPPPAPAPPPPTEGTPAAPAAAPPPPGKSVVNLAGSLRERGTRRPLPGVIVTVVRQSETATGAAPADPAATPEAYEAVTDADGDFVFYDLTAGDWLVVVEASGYQRIRTTETVRPGERVDVTYHVERASDNPYDVTVTAERPRKEVSRTTIKREEIDKVPGGAGDPLAVVQNFAGVARTPINGEIVIRGSAPEDSRVYLDGTEIPLLYHFGGLRSVIPMAILDSLEFYPGNFGPEYGRATGGILDVRIKEIKPERIGGTADLSVLDLGLTLEAPIGKKGGIAIAARRSHIDAVLPVVIPEDSGIDLITAPRYYDAEVVASYRPAPGHDLRAMFIGSDDRLTILFDNPAEVDPEFTGNTFGATISFVRGLLSYKYTPNAQVENTLRLSSGFNWTRFGGGDFLIDIDSMTSQLRDEVRVKLHDRLTLTTGLDVWYGRINGVIHADAAGPPREGEPDEEGLDDTELSRRFSGLDYWAPAVHAELEIEPVKGVRLLPGIRVDYFQRTGQALVQPRGTVRWELDPRFALKAGVGRFVQEPDFVETDAVFGNPDVNAESALHYSAGVEWKPRAHLSFDVTGFYKDLDDQVSRSEALVMDDNGMTRPLRYENLGVGRVYGLELMARHEMTRNFSGWIAYTLSKAERRDAASDPWRLFDYDQPHILTVVGTYRLPWNMQLGARFRLVSGNPDTPVVGSVYDASEDEYHPVYGETNSDRIAAFHQLDIRLDKKWVFNEWMFNLYLDVQNVYNRANPEGTSYNFDYTESEPVRGLPILPILGLRGEL
jgi:TonB family protein